MFLSLLKILNARTLCKFWLSSFVGAPNMIISSVPDNMVSAGTEEWTRQPVEPEVSEN